MVTVYTDTPEALLRKIKKAIDDDDVRTWGYDDEGKFYHTPAQWKDKARLEPAVKLGMVTLTARPGPAGNYGAEDYAVYHGRFIEMLIKHFSESFESIKTSGLPSAQK